MKSNAIFQFEIESLEEGEPLDPVEVSVFQQHLQDLLNHADFAFRILDLKMIYGE